jgi:hypothetical protein
VQCESHHNVSQFTPGVSSLKTNVSASRVPVAHVTRIKQCNVYGKAFSVDHENKLTEGAISLICLKKKSLVCSLENHESIQTTVNAGCNLNNNACDTSVSVNLKGKRKRLVWWHGLFRNIATNYRLTYTYSNICNCI